MMKNKITKGIFSNKNFMLLWLGQLVSNLGSRMHSLAVMWYVLEKTGSTLQMGVTLVFTILPNIIISPFAGVYADRWDRKKIIVVTDFINGLLVGIISILVFTNNLSLHMLYLLSAAMSVTSAFFSPAIGASIPSIVEKENLVKANSLSQVSSNNASIFGPILGGILISAIGIPGLFLLNSISFLISSFSELFITIPKVKRDLSAKVTVLDDIKEAFKYTKKSKTLLHFMVVGGFIINFFLAPLQILVTVHAKEILGLGSEGVGVLLSAFAIGSLIMAVLVPQINKKVSHEALTVVGLTGEGIAMVLFSTTSNVYTAFASLIIFGFSIAICNVSLRTVFQTIVPNNMLGRIGSAFGVICSGMIPLGYFVGGLLLESYSVTLITFIFGIIVALAGLSTITVVKESISLKKNVPEVIK